MRLPPEILTRLRRHPHGADGCALLVNRLMQFILEGDSTQVSIALIADDESAGLCRTYTLVVQDDGITIGGLAELLSPDAVKFVPSFDRDRASSAAEGSKKTALTLLLMDWLLFVRSVRISSGGITWLLPGGMDGVVGEIQPPIPALAPADQTGVYLEVCGIDAFSPMDFRRALSRAAQCSSVTLVFNGESIPRPYAEDSLRKSHDVVTAPFGRVYYAPSVIGDPTHYAVVLASTCIYGSLGDDIVIYANAEMGDAIRFSAISELAGHQDQRNESANWQSVIQEWLAGDQRRRLLSAYASRQDDVDFVTTSFQQLLRYAPILLNDIQYLPGTCFSQAAIPRVDANSHAFVKLVSPQSADPIVAPDAANPGAIGMAGAIYACLTGTLELTVTLDPDHWVYRKLISRVGHPYRMGVTGSLHLFQLDLRSADVSHRVRILLVDAITVANEAEGETVILADHGVCMANPWDRVLGICHDIPEFPSVDFLLPRLTPTANLEACLWQSDRYTNASLGCLTDEGELLLSQMEWLLAMDRTSAEGNNVSGVILHPRTQLGTSRQPMSPALFAAIQQALAEHGSVEIYIDQGQVFFRTPDDNSQ